MIIFYFQGWYNFTMYVDPDAIPSIMPTGIYTLKYNFTLPTGLMFAINHSCEFKSEIKTSF
jgi:hypothetical protein